MKRGGTRRRHSGEIRVIAGKWRGRRLRFTAVPGLRPTPDRLRETLFNWLGGWIVGRRVLDLYAGSGALGIEALSRGAGAAVFVERSAAAATALRANLAGLGAAAAIVEDRDALAFLHSASSRFDLVFVDPPWESGLALASLDVLAVRPLLAADHRVYLEQAAVAPSDLPVHWGAVKAARAGGVRGRLLALRDGSRQESGRTFVSPGA